VIKIHTCVPGDARPIKARLKTLLHAGALKHMMPQRAYPD
jgi:hypothetical protein